MTPGLAGKTAVVTGGARGIGRATVDCLRAEGARVVAIDVNPDPAEAGDEVLAADVTDAESIGAAIASVAEPAGLDICVANAGVTDFRPMLEATPAHWRRVLEVNLFGLVHTFTAAARLMVAAGHGGTLLATSSVAGLRGEACAAAYCASKAAVIAVCQSLALELAPHHITVNAIAPGEVDTGLHARLMEQIAAENDANGQSAAEVRAAFLEARVPLRRMASPAEVATAITFLVGPGAEYITGETLRFDGGELLT